MAIRHSIGAPLPGGTGLCLAPMTPNRLSQLIGYQMGNLEPARKRCNRASPLLEAHVHAEPVKTGQAEKRQRAPAAPQPLGAAIIPDALLKLSTAASLAGLSEPTLYRKAATDPSFPRLVKMGRRCTRIRAGDLVAWLAAQAGAAR